MNAKKKLGYTKDTKALIDERRQFIGITKLFLPEHMERMHIDKDGIRELAENIKGVGLIHPLVVKSVKDRFAIISGRRRFLALKMLAASKISCVVFDGKNYEMEFIKLSENLLREDLTDVEEGLMLARIIKMSKMDVKKLAGALGKSESFIRQKLAVGKYPDILKEALQSKLITFSVSRELVRIRNFELMREYLRHAVKGGATPALVKEWVDEIVRQEKLRKGLEESDDGPKIGLQVQAPMFECHLCKKQTDLFGSKLYRVCHPCIKIVDEGGQAINE